MSGDGSQLNRAVNAGLLAAVVMIGQQVAGKATRDAIFLTNYAIESLPPMIIAASVVSIAVALAGSRLMTKLGPGLLVPRAFAVSAALFLAEWGLLGLMPRIVAVALYIHMAVFAGILISGFWSLVNEAFDPHTAKQKIGRITLGANLGGLLGGLAAERTAALVGVEVMLPVMAGMHLVCAFSVAVLAAAPGTGSGSVTQTSPAGDGEQASGFRVLARMPYLRQLAALVLVGTIAAGLIDYLFKAEAAAEFREGDQLLRFFAIYYTGVALLTLLAQAGLARRSLDKLGLARTVATLPAAVIATGAAALAIPGIVTATIVRSTEAVLRNSLFRSGYELLYTPVPRAQKRATKLIIDVGFDRMGDALGAGLVAVLLLLGPDAARVLLLVLAVAFALAALAIALMLRRGYVKALEKSLLTQASELDLDDVQDSTTRLTLLETMGAVDIKEALKSAMIGTVGNLGAKPEPASAPAAPQDAVVERIAALRSGDPAIVRRVLLEPQPRSLTLVPHIVPLLAWDEVQRDAVAALRKVAPRVTGQLVDTLLDSDEEFAIRRRIPRILGMGDPARAAAGMVNALGDRRFEVRYHCARALLHIRVRHPEIRLERPQIVGVVRRELEVSRRVWDSHRLLDTVGVEDSLLVDEVLAERASRSLEHVFNLLSLVYPRDPLKIAFRGLHTDDPMLRGTALEYLETTLPDDLRAGLWTYLDAERSGGPPPTETEPEALDRLMESMQSIELNLSELRRRLRED